MTPADYALCRYNNSLGAEVGAGVLCPWSDSVHGSAVLVLTDLTVIKIQLNDTFMQMFFKLLLAHKVSYVFIFTVSSPPPFLETKQITIMFIIAHPPQEGHNQTRRQSVCVFAPLVRMSST
jgi:hypothetical protein